ncbi:MAG: hypothetical protein ACTTKK_02995 [Ottowia sp.]
MEMKQPCPAMPALCRKLAESPQKKGADSGTAKSHMSHIPRGEPAIEAGANPSLNSRASKMNDLPETP